jgi:two-component system NtrC family sensor kinase
MRRVMRRSVSARVFASLLLVMAAFSGVLGYTVHRMNQVRRQLELISTSYLRLTLVLGELDAVQRNLLETLADRVRGESGSRFVRRQVSLARQFRLHEVRRALELVDLTARAEPALVDQQFLLRTERRLRFLESGFTRSQEPFERLFEREQPLSVEEVRAIGRSVQPRERKLAKTIRRLRDELRSRMREAARELEADQRRGVWAGLGLVTAALLFSLAVSFRLRQTLKPLRTLVDGTKRIGSGDYAERVPVQSYDELGLLAGEFNKMADALQERERRLIQSERMAAAGMLASHITHEVRNPLNSISLNTEVLEEELSGLSSAGGTATEARALCGAIRREVDRLTEITEDYLRFARLPKPTLQLEDLNEILSSMIGFLREEMRERGISCRQQLTPDLPRILVDENQLRQALLNLLRNSIDALGAEGGEIVVSSARLDDVISIRIRDSGPGIEAEKLDRVFEPFFSTKEHGTGLGLPITHRIVLEHHGSVQVESQPGEGTAFTVLLPVSRARDKVAQQSREV